MKRSLVTTSILAAFAVLAVGCDHGGDAASVSARAAPAPRTSLGKRLLRASSASSTRARLAKGAARATTPAHAPPIPPRYQAFAAAFELERTSQGVPGAAVAILEHGEVTFARGFGTAGPNSAKAVDPDTIFRVGTTTAALTAAAELALVGQGKASLDESITKLVPNVALREPNASLLTVRDLLSSQSGLFDFTALSSPLATLSCATEPATLGSFVTGAPFQDNELFFNRPGLLYTSSNPSFILTGAAIEHESGAFYPDAMRAALFQPLGMTRTFFVPSEVTSAGNYSEGLSRNPDGTPWDVAPAAYDCAAYRPFGYAFSSATDYAKFVRFLLVGDPRVLPEASRLAMQSGHVLTGDFGKLAAEGYGLSVLAGYVSPRNVYYPTKTVSSVGGLPGFTSEIFFLPETGFGFVVLANADYAQFGDALDVAVQSFAGLPSPAALPPSTNAVPSAFASYAGTYRDPSKQLGTIVVSARGGGLTIDFPEATTLGFTFYPELSPVFNGSFLVAIDGSPTPLAFIAGADGRYDHLVVADLIAATRVP